MNAAGCAAGAVGVTRHAGARASRLGRLLRAAALLLWAGLSGPVLAHKASDAYVTWQVDGAVVTQRFDIALRDLDRDMDLDADDDGQLHWGEVRVRWSEIQQFASAALQLRADGHACTQAAAGTPQLDAHVDGRYAVLRSTWTCAQPVRHLEADYRLFASTDPTHRGIARLLGPHEGSASAVLVPGAAPQSWAVPGEGAAPSPRDFFGFVAEGAHHIAIGLDHVLFLATLMVVAVWRREGRGWVPRDRAWSAWKETLRLVTAFTLAHSITLGLAASGVLAPPSRWVETLIAVSVLVAAVDNLWPLLPGPRWPVVSMFGLIHGFGFAGPLQDLGLREGQLALPLLGFNLGVELGQLALIALLLPLAIVLRHRRGYEWVVVRAGSACVALVALSWTLERGFEMSLWP